MNEEELKKLIAQNEKLIAQNELMYDEIHELKNICGRMDNHISFVEHVYSILRAPLDWFVIKWYGKSDPKLTNNQDLLLPCVEK